MNSFDISTLPLFEKKLNLQNYSRKTIASYLGAIRVVNAEIGKSLYHCSNKDIERFFLGKEFSSRSQQNVYISAVKLFFKYVANKRIGYINLERPRKEKHLPRVIEKNKLLEKINAILNLKHKAIISLGFSVGLRVSEVCNLEITDIDSARMLIHIRNAKGKKDRFVPLTDTILKLLRNYVREYRPKKYLFEGQKGEQYSHGSCEKIVKKYIDPNIGFHCLRHSSFTSMLESGTDLRLIQSIAGHKSPNTTAIYTHVSADVLRTASTPI